MSRLPLVTIITPAYNRADLIGATIESVLEQDYPHLEYIVLDDGSSDRTLAMIKEYDGRLRWESHANIGETATVNRGFALARGEIIGVVNSDDPLLPGAVSKLVAALLAHPEAVVAYPDWQMIDGDGVTLQVVRTYDYHGPAEMVRRHYCLPGPGALFRRRVVDELGGRDPAFRYVGDLDFWFRAALIGPLLRVPEVLATFRSHGDSATVSQQGSAMADEHLALVEKFFRRRDLPPAVQEIRAEAIGSACFVAATVCGAGARRQKLDYLWRALRASPAKYGGEYARRWPLILATLCNVPYLGLYYRLKRLEGRWSRRR